MELVYTGDLKSLPSGVSVRVRRAAPQKNPVLENKSILSSKKGVFEVWKGGGVLETKPVQSKIKLGVDDLDGFVSELGPF